MCEKLILSNKEWERDRRSGRREREERKMEVTADAMCRTPMAKTDKNDATIR